jgi:NADH-quinone oxidoreductase subunit L
MRQMGGLGRQMPFVRNAFLIGALGLAGLPILNGFWSKELVLEGGLDGGPQWAYGVMLVCAGLTALYTFRMVWLVFYGERHGEKPAHDALVAMRVSLLILAAGTLTTWLMAGAVSDLLSRTLPLHALKVTTTREMVLTVLTAWPTGVALAVIALGLGAWWWRDRLSAIASGLHFLSRAASADFGFAWLNRFIAQNTKRVGEILALTQTGQLNLNVLGIASALVIILVILGAGSMR